MAYLQLQCMRSYIYDCKGHIRLFLALSGVVCLFKGRASVLVMKHQAFIQLCIANSESSSYKPANGGDRDFRRCKHNTRRPAVQNLVSENWNRTKYIFTNCKHRKGRLNKCHASTWSEKTVYLNELDNVLKALGILRIVGFFLLICWMVI